ncbi:MAG: hypothetical protein IAE80_17950 [Anaerolinea sp.]|nr:hypothetical protein [Anaerolinea sp.]
MSENEGDVRQQVEIYQRIVLRYEELDEQIDALLMAHDGRSDRMSPEDHSRYRDLARQRDELYNEMRALEQRLLSDEE